MSDEFSFDEGDRVLVRVRENGTSGRILAKFVGECVEFRSRHPGTSVAACFKPPWSQIGTVALESYSAEFERLEPDESPSF